MAILDLQNTGLIHEDIANISLANTTKVPYTEDYPNGDWCYKFALDFAEIQAYTIGGVLGIIVINIILKAIMKILVRFERPHSKSEYAVSLSGKLFIVQLINTGLILLLVNGNLSSMGVDNGYSTAYCLVAIMRISIRNGTYP